MVREARVPAAYCRYPRGAAEPCRAAGRRHRCGIRRRGIHACAARRRRRARRSEPRAVAARTGARGAGRGRERARHRGVGRAGILRAGAACARHERLPAEGARNHGHQRQDHDDEPHRPAVPALRQEGRCRGQHQPRDARPARRCDRRNRAARRVGARTVELPARDRAHVRARCGRDPQHHAGPPRLARQLRRVRAGKGPDLRRNDHARAEPRRCGRDEVRAGSRRGRCAAHGHVRPERTGAGRRLRPVARQRHRMARRSGRSRRTG